VRGLGEIPLAYSIIPEQQAAVSIPVDTASRRVLEKENSPAEDVA